MLSIQGSYVKIAAGVAAVAALWFLNQHFIVNPAVDRANAEWQQRWDVRDKADAAAALKQEKQNREKELSLQAAADAEQQKADADRANLARRLADSRAASERLQRGVQAAIDALDTGTAAGSPSGSTARTSAGVLLSELYRSINERAGDLAAEADRSRAAGLTCERLYNNARTAQQEKAR